MAQASSDSPIQDNSFLIEEAYNQEAGVVQHIQLLLRDWESGTWIASFTQEWPVGGLQSQFSYTVLAARVERESGGKTTGFGDLQQNYRYQLVGDGDAPLAVAPRFSLVLPTGSWRRNLGFGGLGLQFHIPASVAISDRFVAHGNAGVTWVSGARNPRGDRADLVVPNLGTSLVFLGAPNWNLLTELVWLRPQEVTGPGLRETRTEFLVNPGARVAWNFSNGLQIVGGISAPIGVGPSRGEKSILLYLSLEHPFLSGRK